MLNYLYDDEAERQIHQHAMEILCREIILPEEEIRELYERELERLKETARVKDFLVVLVCRAVRDTCAGTGKMRSWPHDPHPAPFLSPSFGVTFFIKKSTITAAVRASIKIPAAVMMLFSRLGPNTRTKPRPNIIKPETRFKNFPWRACVFFVPRLAAKIRTMAASGMT